MLFSELGLMEPVLLAIEAEGYTVPTPIQAGAIPPAIAGRDVLGIAQTGTGKTAAFALPTLHRLFCNTQPSQGTRKRIRALAIAPTRELAIQIRDSFMTYGKKTPLRVIAVVGGVSQDTQVRALRNGVDVLVATPGRLVDLMQQGHVDLSQVEIMVLDEADRMFDMGFAPDLRRIMQPMSPKRQNMLFSATMPSAIVDLARSILKDPARIEVKPERTPLEIIEQSVMIVNREHKSAALAAYLKGVNIERGIVFTRTKHGADRVAKVLARSGFPSDAIHGNKRQNIRQRILTDFKNGRIAVLVATDIAARGIDVTGITHVVNFDIPLEAETYVHRIGRTGRAGAGGTAISLCQPDERRLLFAVERVIGKKLAVRTLDPAIMRDLPAQSAAQAKLDEADREFEEREDRNDNGRRGGPSRRPMGGGRRFDGPGVAYPRSAPAGGRSDGPGMDSPPRYASSYPAPGAAAGRGDASADVGGEDAPRAPRPPRPSTGFGLVDRRLSREFRPSRLPGKGGAGPKSKRAPGKGRPRTD